MSRPGFYRKRKADEDHLNTLYLILILNTLRRSSAKYCKNDFKHAGDEINKQSQKHAVRISNTAKPQIVKTVRYMGTHPSFPATL